MPTPSGERRVLPLWTPRGRYEEEHAADLKLDEDAARAQEYRRLLYVAMTRAADRLIVCGHHGASEPSEDCWYRLVEAGLNRFGDDDALVSAEKTIAEGSPIGWTGASMKLTRAQDIKVKPPAAPRLAADAGPPPDWIDAPPPAEPSPPRPLTPSRPDQEDPPVRSPLSGLEGAGVSTGAAIGEGAMLTYRRGRLVHRLLQTVPDLPVERRENACKTYLSRPAHGLDAATVTQLTDEVMAVLQSPDLAGLFGPGSRAEAPLVGLGPRDETGGRAVVSGQVDRLAVTDEAVLVADYKTLRPPPADPANAPVAYLRQMALYRALLREIYPGRPVRCALVWTDGPRLALLPDALLDRFA
jgi:ATP-dependent helicase/nuclease subunit A